MRMGLAVTLGGEDDDWLVLAVALGGDDWVVLTLELSVHVETLRRVED